MATIEFADKQQCENWLKQIPTPQRYEIYITSGNELIIAPNKSTRYLKTGYLIDNENIIETLAQQLEKRGYRIFRIKAYYWSADMTPQINIEQISKQMQER